MPPIVIAHRGASGAAPENTLAAFRKALGSGARMIELDVRLSADDRLMVIHDSLLHRTAGSRGRVETRTCDQLKQLDVGGWFSPAFAGERMPRLEEVLELVAGKLGLDVELKCRRTIPTTERLVRQAIAVLRPWLGRVPMVVSSFHRPAIDLLRRLAPEIPAEYIYGVDTPRPRPSHFEHANPVAIVQAALATSDLIADLHARGGQVYVWTVDDPAEMRRLAALGVDGICTNQPATASQVLQS
ncbi:MAG: glycerophosphodiester phosphodiesterase [Candidatus Xenobia bacterium]